MHMDRKGCTLEKVASPVLIRVREGPDYLFCLAFLTFFTFFYFLSGPSLMKKECISRPMWEYHDIVSLRRVGGRINS